MAFNPGGTRLATASGDGAARVWDVSWDTGTLDDWRTIVERGDYELNGEGVLIKRAPKSPPP